MATEETDESRPRFKVIRSKHTAALAESNIDRRRIRLTEEKIEKEEKTLERERRKRIVATVFLLSFLGAIWFGMIKYNEYRKNSELEELKAQKADDDNVRKLRELRERKADRGTPNQAANTKTLYVKMLSALSEGKFYLFAPSVTNGLAKSGGAACLCLPAKERPIPLYKVEFTRRGAAAEISKVREDCKIEPLSGKTLSEMLDGQDFLLASGGKVYFGTSRRDKRTGLLDKTRGGDPAKAFFGTIWPALAELKPKYEGLAFDIYFLPKGSRSKILCERVVFGGKYTIASVKKAVEASLSEGAESGPGTVEKTIGEGRLVYRLVRD